MHGIDPKLIEFVNDDHFEVEWEHPSLETDEIAVTGVKPKKEEKLLSYPHENVSTPKKKKRKNKLLTAQIKARVTAMFRDDMDRHAIVRAISEEFGLTEEEEISPAFITRSVNDAVTYWKEKSMLHIDERQALVLARLDQIEVLATEAYFASCKGKKTTIFEQQLERGHNNNGMEDIENVQRSKREYNKSFNTRVSDVSVRARDYQFMADGDIEDLMEETAQKIKKIIRIEKNPSGDPRFLNIVLDINEKRAKMWGLYERKDRDKDNEQTLARLPDEVREQRILAILHTAKNRSKDLTDLGGKSGMLASPQPLGGFKETKDEPTEFDEYDYTTDEEVDDEEIEEPQDDDTSGGFDWD